jgi:hypothetical protein
MFRRSLLAVAGLAMALGLAAGCGPIFRSTQKVEAALQKAELALMPNRLDYTVYQPPHRVALATYEVIKAEFVEVKVRDIDLTLDDHFNTPDGKMPKPGEAKIPDDYPACWLDGLNPTGPVIVNFRSCEFEGKTKDGQWVEAVVRLEIMGSDMRSVVSAQVGRMGDQKATKSLIDKICIRIREPRTKPGSPEELTALNDAFAPKPGKDEKKLVDAKAGEYQVRKN